MNKMQLLKHTINYHVAQVNLEADITEEPGNWIDQYPPLQPRVYTSAATQKNSIVIVDAPNAKYATVVTRRITPAIVLCFAANSASSFR